MRFFLVLLLLFSPFYAFAEDFHTPPSKWQKPRVFHSSLQGGAKETFEKNIKISHIRKQKYLKAEVILSPNDAYWYVVREHEDKRKCISELLSCPVKMYIFNERDYLIEISFNNLFKNSALMAYWINEKLLYLEAWWNKKSGIYFIYDVEKEKIIKKEAVIEGSEVFENAE